VARQHQREYKEETHSVNQFKAASYTNQTDFVTSLHDIRVYSTIQNTHNQIRLSEYLGKAYVKHQVYEVWPMCDTGS